MGGRAESAFGRGYRGKWLAVTALYQAKPPHRWAAAAPSRPTTVLFTSPPQLCPLPHSPRFASAQTLGRCSCARQSRTHPGVFSHGFSFEHGVKAGGAIALGRGLALGGKLAIVGDAHHAIYWTGARQSLAWNEVRWRGTGAGYW